MPPTPMKKTDLEGLISRTVQAILGESLASMVQEQVTRAQDQMRTTFYAEHFTSPGGAPTFRGETGREEPGINAARYIRAIAASYLSTKSGGAYVSALDFAKREWGSDATVTRVLSATDFSSGGAAVPQQVSAEIIELLRPASVVRRMNPVVMGMDNGTMTIPKMTGGATASYTQENNNIGVTGQTFGDVQLIARKLAAIVVLSNDWLRRKVAGADGMVRDDTVAAIAQRSDLAFIRGDGTSNTPRGLRYLVTSANTVAAQASPDLAKVTSDLGDMLLALRDDETRMLRPGWLWAPRTTIYLMTLRDGNGNYVYRDEMLTGKLWGLPFADTTQIPVNLGGSTNESEIYLADFADVVIGETTQLILDMSGEAAYHDGSAVQAAFSKDQTVLRAIVEHDMGLRHDGSVAVMTGVTWGA